MFQNFKIFSQVSSCYHKSEEDNYQNYHNFKLTKIKNWKNFKR